MKRPNTVCLTASMLLALSTVAWAKDATLSLPVDVTWDNTVSTGFTKSGGTTNITITWFQPYDFTAKAPDLSPYPVGGKLSDPNNKITSAKLTIKAWGISPAGILGQPAQQDTVYVGQSSGGPWKSLNVNLTTSTVLFGQGDSTTTITLSDPNLVKGTKGFWVQVRLQDGNQDDYVKSAQLQVTVRSTYTYTFTPKKVVFVSAQHASAADANAPGDKGFVDLLRTAYYEVDYTAGAAAGICYWDTLDPNKLAVLNAADLVIIGRDTRVADLAADATTVAAWNGLRTPVLLMNSYLAANDAWQWVDSAGANEQCSYYYLLKAVDTTNPLFASVAFDINDVVTDPNKTPVAVKNTVQWYDATVASRYTCFVATADAGNGKVLAVRPDTGAILIAEWAAGNPFYATSTQIPAWHRLFFNAGTESLFGVGTNWGVMNLNAAGQKIFLNAVAYMIPQPVPSAAK